MTILVILSFTSACCCNEPLNEIGKISLPLVKDIDRADIYFTKLPMRPRAILILCPGHNGNGEFLVKDRTWQKFALDNGWGLIGISFASSAELLIDGRGYYYPNQGSGQLLEKGIALAYKTATTSPLLLYGFSGGAHFTSRFSEWKPERVKAWCSYSAAWWDEPRLNTTAPPGIVACGLNDVHRYGASLMYFNKGRALGKPWVWVSLQSTGHSLHSGLDKFVRAYFLEIIQASSNMGQWYDIETKRVITKTDTDQQPTLSVWLPSEKLADLWSSLHEP